MPSPAVAEKVRSDLVRTEVRSDLVRSEVRTEVRARGDRPTDCLWDGQLGEVPPHGRGQAFASSFEQLTNFRFPRTILVSP